ncbi:serine type protease [Tribonema minus]|uniref:Serine type protease n=1 Tax=Tribonema minus TaxID=303371 RepID=A0A836C9K9_9STRA|nr:serine type protease [Tribonema minus]
MGTVKAGAENGLIKVFEQSTPGVVYISTFVNQRDAFSMNILEVPAGTGSGFVWDKEGHIVTNFHVIRSANTAQVRITDPSTGKQASYAARVQGYDPDKDVAVLKIDAPPEQLQPIPLGSSAVLKVGQLALAIGNPFGLDHTLTTGVISGLGREVRSPSGRPISNVVQTDAAINPGNSGGPLLNSAGQITGMNTAIYSPSGASAGIGFAIPIDTIKTIVGMIIETGSVTRPVIGITYLQSAQAKALGIDDGVLVLDVPAGSAAEKAGLRGTARSRSGYIELGDIITMIDGDKISNEVDLFKALEDRKPGDVITITVTRTNMEDESTQEVKLRVTLQQSATPTAMSPLAPVSPPMLVPQ